MTPIARAARALSVRPSEIADAEDSPGGLVIRTVDGASYIDVPADTPDGAGRTGLMMLEPRSKPGSYAIPTYTQPPAEADDEEIEARAVDVSGAPIAALASEASDDEASADEGSAGDAGGIDPSDITADNLPDGVEKAGRGRYRLADGTEVAGIDAVRAAYTDGGA